MAFAGVGRTAVCAFRSLARPTRRRPHALEVVVRCGISQALRAVWSVSGRRPVMWCVPPPTLVLRRCAASACALVCPSAPPGGSLSPRAYWVGFATGFVAFHARNTGATGLTACKPAWPLAYFSNATVILITIVLKATWRECKVSFAHLLEVALERAAFLDRDSVLGTEPTDNRTRSISGLLMTEELVPPLHTASTEAVMPILRNRFTPPATCAGNPASGQCHAN